MANGAGAGASAAGGALASFGQLLMQRALRGEQEREREAQQKALADYRQKNLDLAARRTDISELGAMMGPGETATPFTPDMQVLEGARTVGVGERSFMVRPPPPRPTDLPYSVTTGGVTTRVGTPTEAVAFREQFAPPETPRTPTPSERLSE